MKYLRCFIISSILQLLFSLAAFSQAPTIQWQQCYGDIDGLYISIQKIFQQADSSYLFGGTANLEGVSITNHGGDDIWLQKLSSTGNNQWKKSYGGPGYDALENFITTPDNGYLLIGATYANGGQITGFHTPISGPMEPDIWLVKINDTGMVQWAHAYGGSDMDISSNVIMTFDGGYLFTGATFSSDGDVDINHGIQDTWVVKLDSAGNIEWSKTFGGSGYDYAIYPIQTADSGYIVSCLTYSNDGDVLQHYGSTDSSDSWVIKLDKNGNLQWQRTYGGSGNENAGILHKAQGSGYYMYSGSSSNDFDVSGNHGGYDDWIVRLDDSFHIIWQKCIGGTGDDYAGPGVFLDNDAIVGIGSTTSNDGVASGNHGGTDAWLVKMDSAANVIWQEEIGADGLDVLGDIIMTSDSGFIACGLTYSNPVCGDTGRNAWVVKLSKDALGIPNTEYKNNIKVYPTVTSGTVSIEYPANANKTMLHLYNSIGQSIPFAAADNAAGKTITIAGQPEGVYLLQVSSAAGVAVFRILYRP